MPVQSLEPKRRPNLDDLLADLWPDAFADDEKWDDEPEPAGELYPDLTPAQEARLREVLLLAAAQRFDEAAAQEEPPSVSAKAERKIAKMLANPFKYARRQAFYENLRHYAVVAALLLLICGSLFLQPSSPTWATSANYVPVYERGVLSPYLLERFAGVKPAEDCWQPPKIDTGKRWFDGGMFDERFNE